MNSVKALTLRATQKRFSGAKVLGSGIGFCVCGGCECEYECVLLCAVLLCVVVLCVVCCVLLCCVLLCCAVVLLCCCGLCAVCCVLCVVCCCVVVLLCCCVVYVCMYGCVCVHLCRQPTTNEP